MRFFRWLAGLLVVVVPFGLVSRHKPRHYREMRAIVAISAPSSLAIELSERFRVLLIGFARVGGFTVYAGRFRLQGAG